MTAGNAAFRIRLGKVIVACMGQPPDSATFYSKRRLHPHDRGMIPGTWYVNHKRSVCISAKVQIIISLPQSMSILRSLAAHIWPFLFSVTQYMVGVGGIKTHHIMEKIGTSGGRPGIHRHKPRNQMIPCFGTRQQRIPPPGRVCSCTVNLSIAPPGCTPGLNLGTLDAM